MAHINATASINIRLIVSVPTVTIPKSMSAEARARLIERVLATNDDVRVRLADDVTDAKVSFEVLAEVV